jgi:lysozyme family protein
MADPQVQAPLSSVTPEQAASEPGFQTGTKAKPTITNQAVLSELENIYKQRKAEKEYFLNPLKQAAVGWWNPQGPGVGLPLADEMRRAQDAELMDLQSKIITGKIGIGQLQGAMGSLQGPETTAPRTSIAGAPAATGTAAIVPNARGGYAYRGVPLDADDFNVINGFLSRNDLTAADAYLEKIVLERTKFTNNPAAYVQQERWNPDKGRKEYQMPIETRDQYLRGATPTAPTQAPAPTAQPTSVPIVGADANIDRVIKVEGGYKPVDGVSGAPVNYGINQRANPDVNVKTLTPEKARVIYKERYWDAIDGDKLPPATAMVALDAAANQGVDYTKKLIEKTGGDPMKMLDQREMDYRKLAKTDPRQAENLNGWLNRVSDLRKEISATPTTTTAPTAPRRFNSKSEQEAYEKQQAEFLTKSSGKAGEEVGKRQAFFESAAADASKDLQTSNVLLNIIDKNPAGIGFAYKNKALGTIVEGIKFATGKDIQPLARMATLSKEDMDAALKFDKYAQENNLKFRQAVMKGTGQVSDFETKLAERASGLALDTSLEANRFFATVAAENFRMLDKLGPEWQNYQKRNPGVTFDKFEQSPEFKKALKERETRLTSYFPELGTSESAFGSSKPKSNASSQEVEGWKQRYGRKPQ